MSVEKVKLVDFKVTCDSHIHAGESYKKDDVIKGVTEGQAKIMADMNVGEVVKGGAK